MLATDLNVRRRRLTLATIIFLPLTLLTGYFVSITSDCSLSQSLTTYPSAGYELRKHVVYRPRPQRHNVSRSFLSSDALAYLVFPCRFWEIAIPVMVIVIPLFLFSDFKRMAHYIEKRLKRRKITKVRGLWGFIYTAITHCGRDLHSRTSGRELALPAERQGPIYTWTNFIFKLVVKSWADCHCHV